MRLSLFLLWAVILVTACSKASTDQPASTLETGLVVTESEACTNTEATETLAIKKADDGYSVVAVADLECGLERPRPFLTITLDQKATLVLGREPGKSASGCECRRRVKVSIKGRLEPGDVLYLLNDYTVIGHVLVP